MICAAAVQDISMWDAPIDVDVGGGVLFESGSNRGGFGDDGEQVVPPPPQQPRDAGSGFGGAWH
jgi:hypothetical protein